MAVRGFCELNRVVFDPPGKCGSVLLSVISQI